MPMHPEASLQTAYLLLCLSITGLPVQRDAASQTSESVVDTVSDLLLTSIIVLAVLLHARVSESGIAGGSAFRVQAPLATVDMQLGAVTTFMQRKGSSQTPRFGVFGTCSLQLLLSEGVLLQRAPLDE